jgi:hypothetical protein
LVKFLTAFPVNRAVQPGFGKVPRERYYKSDICVIGTVTSKPGGPAGLFFETGLVFPEKKERPCRIIFFRATYPYLRETRFTWNAPG